MEINKTAASGAMGFNVPSASNNKQETATDSLPVEEQHNNVDNKAADDSEDEYTDVSSVTITLVKNYSLYRKANDKVLPKRHDSIGSSITSSRVLGSNKEEIEAYFPTLLGIAPNNPDFITRVKQYLNNIKISVDELGRTFNTSFHYYKKKDYYRVKREEEKIEEAYKLVNRNDVENIRRALTEKITKLNALESSKHKYGYPIVIEDYLMYRHCLLYNDVAKDMAMINSNPSIRFYFKDDAKEAERLKKYRIDVNKAKANYVACLADDDLFDAVYIQYCVHSNLPVISSLAEDRLAREIKLDKFSTDEPIKFNKIFANKDIKLIANIERLIARGELIRSQFNQNITTPEGDFIGANIKEAVAWFKNVDNTSVVNVYMNKLKNI